MTTKNLCTVHGNDMKPIFGLGKMQIPGYK